MRLPRIRQTTAVLASTVLIAGGAAAPSAARTLDPCASGAAAASSEPLADDIPFDDLVPTEEEMAAQDSADSAWEAERGLPPDQAYRTTPVAVHVTFWVFYDRQTGEGRYDGTQIWPQMSVLNEAYGASRFDFQVDAINHVGLDTRRVNPSGRPGQWPDRTQRLAREHHAGGKQHLNVWVADLGGSALGLGTFPWWVDNWPSMNGVWLEGSTMPRTAAPDKYGLGDILVHEVGHWLGLYHVFQGDCQGRGDRVGDTPRMATWANRNCVEGQDSCHEQAGNDPVHNHMNYTGDPCRSHFSPGQRARLSNQWDRHRA